MLFKDAVRYQKLLHSTVHQSYKLTNLAILDDIINIFFKLNIPVPFYWAYDL